MGGGFSIPLFIVLLSSSITLFSALSFVICHLVLCVFQNVCGWFVQVLQLEWCTYVWKSPSTRWFHYKSRRPSRITSSIHSNVIHLFPSHFTIESSRWFYLKALSNISSGWVGSRLGLPL